MNVLFLCALVYVLLCDSYQGEALNIAPHRRRHRSDSPLALSEGPSLNGLAKLLNGTTYTYLAKRVGLEVLTSLQANATLFMPTNEAFDQHLRGDDLMKNAGKLRKLLAYHIVRGIFERDDLNDEVTLHSYAKESGDETGLIRSTFYGFLKPPVRLIGHAALTDTSARAVGGMIHVISAVLRPPIGNIVETLSADGRFRKFAKLIARSNMTEILSCDPNIPFTILAPNNGAFKNLEPHERQLLRDEDYLRKVVGRHIVNLTFFSQGIQDGIQLQTLSDDSIRFKKREDKVRVMWGDIRARCVTMDITSTNGVIHEVDKIML